jgi:putative hydrolase of the HAD superfamily
VIVRGLKAIVFDLDDTLFLERDYALSGFRAVAKWAERHIGVSAEEAYSDLTALFEEGVRSGTFDAWLAANGRPLDTVPAMVQVFRDHDPIISPVPAAVELLKELRSEYLLGLVTDGYSSVQRKKLAALGLRFLFDAVVVSDDHGRAAWKPNPLPFQIALEELGVAGQATVYVADNPVKDFLGARKAGLWSIRVRAPEGVYQNVEPKTPDHDADVEIERLGDLMQAIESIEALSRQPSV